MKPGVFPTTAAHLLVLAVLGGLVYSKTFHAPFVLDDDGYLVTNLAIRDFGYFLEPSKVMALENMKLPFRYAFQTRIVTFFTFALNYRLHGLDLAGYHFVNLMIHLINAMLVYMLVKNTLATPFFRSRSGKDGDSLQAGSRDILPFFTALLFVAHPVQTQAVTYISQRFTTLATMFYLLSVAAYAGSRRSRSTTAGWGLYAVSLSSAVLAMLAKEISFTLPGTLALYEILFFEEGSKKRIALLAPFVLTMMLIPLRLAVAGGAISDPGLVGDSMITLAAGPALSPLDYLMTQFRVIVTYIRLLVFPVGQNLDYDFPIYRSFLDPRVLLSFLFLLILFSLGVYLFLRSRRNDPDGRQELRLASFGILWFFLTLSVESSVIPIADVIFEHRIYLPSAGFLLAFVALAAMGWHRLHRLVPEFGKSAIPVLIPLVLILSTAAYSRNAVWSDGITLWKDAAGKSPGKARPHNNLGAYFEEAGRLEEAAREFRSAASLDPKNPEIRFNLGLVNFRLGRFDNAIGDLEATVSLRPEDSEAHYNLGLLYGRVGRPDLATKEMNTSYAIRHYEQGKSYLRQGLPEEAIREFQAAIRLNPNHAGAIREIGVATGLRNR
jgi:tetratricopeptide (TPR) repeat protein